MAGRGRSGTPLPDGCPMGPSLGCWMPLINKITLDFSKVFAGSQKVE